MPVCLCPPVKNCGHSVCLKSSFKYCLLLTNFYPFFWMIIFNFFCCRKRSQWKTTPWTKPTLTVRNSYSLLPKPFQGIPWFFSGNIFHHKSNISKVFNWIGFRFVLFTISMKTFTAPASWSCCWQLIPWHLLNILRASSLRQYCGYSRLIPSFSALQSVIFC